MTGTIDQIWIDEAKHLDEAAQRRKLAVNKVDALNDAAYEKAVGEGATFYMHLHPTKGYRRMSFKRMNAGIEGKQGMAYRISSTLGRAKSK